MVEIGTTHNVGSSLRVWLVTLPDQHLSRPYLAECVLAIALGLGVSGVNSSVQVQCVVAFKTFSVELLSSEPLVCVLVSSHLGWLIDYVSSWGTTRTDTCILLVNGSVHSCRYLLMGFPCKVNSYLLISVFLWNVALYQDRNYKILFE